MSKSKSKSSSKNGGQPADLSDRIQTVKSVVGKQFNVNQIKAVLKKEGYDPLRAIDVFLNNEVKTAEPWEVVQDKKHKEKKPQGKKGGHQKASWGERSEAADRNNTRNQNRSNNRRDTNERGNSRNNTKYSNRDRRDNKGGSGDRNNDRRNNNRDGNNNKNDRRNNNRDNSKNTKSGGRTGPTIVKKSEVINAGNKGQQQQPQQHHKKQHHQTHQHPQADPQKLKEAPTAPAPSTNAWSNKAKISAVKMSPAERRAQIEAQRLQAEQAQNRRNTPSGGDGNGKKNSDRENSAKANNVQKVEAASQQQQQAAGVQSPVKVSQKTEVAPVVSKPKAGVVLLPGLSGAGDDYGDFRFASGGAGRRAAKKQQEQQQQALERQRIEQEEKAAAEAQQQSNVAQPQQGGDAHSVNPNAQLQQQFMQQQALLQQQGLGVGPMGGNNQQQLAQGYIPFGIFPQPYGVVPAGAPGFALPQADGQNQQYYTAQQQQDFSQSAYPQAGQQGGATQPATGLGGNPGIANQGYNPVGFNQLYPPYYNPGFPSYPQAGGAQGQYPFALNQYYSMQQPQANQGNGTSAGQRNETGSKAGVAPGMGYQQQVPQQQYGYQQQHTEDGSAQQNTGGYEYGLVPQQNVGQHGGIARGNGQAQQQQQYQQKAGQQQQGAGFYPFSSMPYGIPAPHGGQQQVAPHLQPGTAQDNTQQHYQQPGPAGGSQ